MSNIEPGQRRGPWTVLYQQFKDPRLWMVCLTNDATAQPRLMTAEDLDKLASPALEADTGNKVEP